MQLARLLMALITVTALTLVACADDAAPADTKPAADPDVALGVGKADTLTNWYVEQVGFFELDADNKAAIAYPTWFNGHLVELTGGQTIDLYVTSRARSLVRVYGPASHLWGSEYLFARAAVRTQTTRDGDIFSTAFTLEVEDDGVYMLVIGPLTVWETEYKYRATCVGGCADDGRYEADADCADGEFCGHNGVVCVTTPCDVSFDVCQERGDVDAACHRDAMCAGDLACVDFACAAPDSCESDDDCKDGWCGCTEAGCDVRACRAWTREGAGCGGHVPAHLVSRCAPDHACVGRGLAYDAPGVCAITVTVEQLLDDPETYDGRNVATAGHVEAPYAMCTLAACGIDNPCCNSCGGEQRLFSDAAAVSGGDGIGLSRDGEVWSCGGDSCSWQDQCTVETGSYWLGGTFVIGEYGQQTLQIEHYWSL